MDLDRILPTDGPSKDEVKKYSHMWRDGGEFSTEKYNYGNIEKKS